MNIDIVDLVEREKTEDPAISLREICLKHELPYQQTYKKVKNSDISPLFTYSGNGKSVSSARQSKLRMRISFSEKEKIRTMYVDERKTLKQIADVYGTTAATVMMFCKNNGIPRRSKSEIMSERMSDPLVRKNMMIKSTDAYVQRKMTDTQPERDFREWLETNNIRYDTQWRKVGNYHPYDFFLTDHNLLVEIDGHFWHSKPEQKLKDQKHTDDAIKKGYNIIRIDTKKLEQVGNNYYHFLGKYFNES